MRAVLREVGSAVVDETLRVNATQWALLRQLAATDDRSADATAYDEAGVGAAVDEMTRKDRALFGVAARRLFRDARRVEKERNTRIFCGDSRRALQRYAAIRLNRTLA